MGVKARKFALVIMSSQNKVWRESRGRRLLK